MRSTSNAGYLRHIVFLALIVTSESLAYAQQAEFRWLEPNADATVFKQVEAAFSDELEPDQPGHTGNVLPSTVKYLNKVGMFGDTALVIVGYKENKDDRYPIFRGFTFHLGSRQKTIVRGAKENSGWLPMWQFVTIAHFEDKRFPDVVFRFFSCTECEAQQLLASFKYDAGSRAWTLRHWSGEDGDDLMVGSDNQYADEGTLSYECLYTVRDLTRSGLDDVAVRCQESVEAESGKPKLKKDETLLYAFRNGALVRSVLRRSDPMNAGVQVALCRRATKSSMCSER